ncbi:MAG: EpsG family protein [Bacteroidales bacterium]|nr:EpsG family protein [Bacteroidales bacterium]
MVNQRRLNNNWWMYLALPISLYAFVVGTRWGWGTDYLWYKLRFENPNYVEENFGWRALNIFLGDIGFNYVGAYIIYSLVFILGGVLLLKSYKQNKHMLFLFVLLTLRFSTQSIRQAFAHAFVFIAMFFLNKESQWKWIYIALIIPIIVSIHPSAMITLVLLVCSYFVKKEIGLKYALMIYVGLSACSTFLTQYVADHFSDYISLIPFLDVYFVSYVDNSELWFGEQAIDEERVQSMSAFLLSVMYYCCVFYLCSMSLKYRYNKNIVYVYNLAFIGVCGSRIFILYEILLRVVEPLACLIFIPLGYALSFWTNKTNRMLMTTKERTISRYAIVGIIVYLGLFYGRFLLLNSQSAFVWDK